MFEISYERVYDVLNVEGGAMTRTKISKRQQQAYDFICSFTAAHGYPPSVREIGGAIGLSSPSTVHSHLHKLEDAGYIRRDPNKPRTIEICGPGSEKLQQSVSLARVEQDVSANTVTLPLVGRVAAGIPILAEQNVEENLTLPTDIVGDSSSFVLRVRGESMINAGILDGDYIVVKEQSDAHNGQIVVALIDDSATVKTFYRERGRVRLQPENDTMEPIYADNPTILGCVTGLFRTM